METRRATSKARWLIAAIALFVTVGLTLTACGGDSSSTSGGAGTDATSQSSSGGDAGVAEAEALVEEALQAPTTIGITKPVGKPIPSGKNIDFVVCPASACVQLKDNFIAAAEVLGWEVKELQSGESAGEIQATWDQVVRDAPDAAVYSSITRAQFEPQLKQLEGAGIPVVACCTDDDEGGAVDLVTAGIRDQADPARLLAAWPIADTDGETNSLLLNIPAYTILDAQTPVIEEAYEKWCPGCGLDVLDIPVQSVGKDVPNQVVSYLRSHPDVNYVMATLDSLTQGLPAALKAAGLGDKVKIVGETPDPQNLQQVASGDEAATVAFPIYELGWIWADALSRIFTNQSVEPDRVKLPFQLLTQDNLLSDTEIKPVVQNYEEQFKELWGK
jgi:ribose transport system substrate-binding protein